MIPVNNVGLVEQWALNHDVENLAKMFKVLAHPIRLQIISLLIEGPRCVCELTPFFDFSQPAISKHLKYLVDGQILRLKKEGTKNIYEIANQNIVEIINISMNLKTK